MPAPPAHSSLQRIRVLAASLAVAATGLLPIALLGAVAPRIQEEFGVSGADMGLGVSIFFAVVGIAAWHAGRVVDHWGWRTSIRVTAGISMTTLLGVALLGRTWAAVVGVFVAAAFGFAMAMPASNLVLAREMPADRLGTLFGIKQAAVPVATLLAGVLAPPIALRFGWRWSFVAAVAVPVVAMALVPRAPAADDVALAESGSTPPLVADRTLIVLAIAAGLASFVPGALTTFLVVSGVDVGLSEPTAGGLLALASTAGLLVRLVSGWLVDITDGHAMRGAAVLLITGSIGLALLSSASVPVFVVGALLAYGAGWGWPALFFYGIVRDHIDRPAAATGVVQVGGAAGTAVSPLAFGAIVDAAGYGPAWLLVAGAALAAGVLVWWSTRLPT